MRRILACLLLAPAAALAAPLADPVLAVGQDIKQETGEVTVPGAGAVSVVRYTWRDSAGDPRSVSLVPASGSTSGFAVQFTYKVVDGVKRTAVVNSNPADVNGDGGFGYFVAHELFRDFIGGGQGTIAGLNAEDDSPLGRYFPSTGSAQSVGTTQATHEFRHTYPRWGTIAAVPDPSSTPVSASTATHQKFNLPVVIRWHFVAGQDYPVWTVEHDLTAAADRIAADVRGPYGTVVFNEGNGPDVTALKWGDKFRFAVDSTPGDLGAAALAPGAMAWAWNAANTGRRHNLLGSGNYEFGLVEIVPYASSKYASGYSNLRGLTSASGGCGYGLQALPCDFEWPYQSFQYNYGPPARAKLAWGTAPFLGSSITQSYINPTQTETITGGKGRIRYGVHIVYGRAGAGTPLGLAKASAAVEPAPTLTIGSGTGLVSYRVLGDAGGPYLDGGRALAPWDSVELTATTPPGVSFLAWGGACAGVAGNVCLITMSQSLSVSATYLAPVFDISATITVVTPSPGAGKDLVLAVSAMSSAGSFNSVSTTLSVPVPAGAAYVWAAPTCSLAAGTVTCALGALSPGATLTRRVVFRPAASGVLNVSATVSASGLDSNPANNTANLGVNVAALPAGVAVQRYRLFSPVTKEHLYTTDLNEYNVLGSFVGTWNQEGPIGKVLNNPGSFNGVTATPYYRLYNTSNAQHHWTTDANEYYTLGQFPQYVSEGFDGYIFPTQAAGTIPLYRLLYPFSVPVAGLHHWTIDPVEYNALIASFGWLGEGGSGFVIP